jgi:hypothetical protein
MARQKAYIIPIIIIGENVRFSPSQSLRTAIRRLKRGKNDMGKDLELNLARGSILSGSI